jgi:hypothetical protein
METIEQFGEGFEYIINLNRDRIIAPTTDMIENLVIKLDIDLKHQSLNMKVRKSLHKNSQLREFGMVVTSLVDSDVGEIHPLTVRIGFRYMREFLNTHKNLLEEPKSIEALLTELSLKESSDLEWANWMLDNGIPNSPHGVKALTILILNGMRDGKDCSKYYNVASFKLSKRYYGILEKLIEKHTVETV